MDSLYSYSYSLPYLLFFFYLLVLAFYDFRAIKYGYNRRGIRVLTVVGFLFFFGLRGFVNTDWVSYYVIFDELPTVINANWQDVIANSYGIEAGFVFFTILFKTCIPDYFAWIFVFTFIDIYVLHLFFRRYVQYYVLGFIFFYIFSGLIIEVNLLRNVKSIILFLLSIKYLKENKFFPYFLLNLLGVFFHITSLLYLPLYFILKRQMSLKFVWFLFILGNLIFFLQVEYVKPIVILGGDLIGGRLADLINFYFESELYSKAYGLSLGYIERLLTFLLIVFFYKKLLSVDKDNIIFINAFFIYLFIFLYFSEMQVLLDRLPLLFVFSYWVLYPRIYALIHLRSNRAVFLILLVVYSVTKLILLNDNILQRYDNVLFGIESYEQRKLIFDFYSDQIIL